MPPVHCVAPRPAAPTFTGCATFSLSISMMDRPLCSTDYSGSAHRGGPGGGSGWRGRTSCRRRVAGSGSRRRRGGGCGLGASAGWRAPGRLTVRNGGAARAARDACARLGARLGGLQTRFPGAARPRAGWIAAPAAPAPRENARHSPAALAVGHQMGGRHSMRAEARSRPLVPLEVRTVPWESLGWGWARTEPARPLTSLLPPSSSSVKPAIHSCICLKSFELTGDG